MKCILFLVAVFALQVSAAPSSTQEDDAFSSYNKECISETGIDEDSVRKLVELPGNELLAGNDKLQQYVVCMCKKLGFINPAGLIQKEKVKEFLSGNIMDHPPDSAKDEAEINRVADKCAVQKDTPMETATTVFKCIKGETFYQGDKLESYARKCVSETGVDKDQIEKFRLLSGQDELVAGDVKLQKYIVCLCTKMGLINEEGLVQKDAMKKSLLRYFKDDATVDKVADKCAVQKDTPLATATHMVMCSKAEAANLH